MGERGMYCATVDWASVGTNHNVLERLAYGRRVYVWGQWAVGLPYLSGLSAGLQARLILHVPQVRDLGLLMSRRAATDQDRSEADLRRRLDALIADDQGRIVSLNQDLMFEQPRLSPFASA
jgi:hypothetical protein